MHSKLQQGERKIQTQGIQSKPAWKAEMLLAPSNYILMNKHCSPLLPHAKRYPQRSQHKLNSFHSSSLQQHCHFCYSLSSATDIGWVYPLMEVFYPQEQNSTRCGKEKNLIYMMCKYETLTVQFVTSIEVCISERSYA